MPNRYRLKGASLEEIQAKARAQYGPAARIVSAERVISPGIAGMFAANRYEAVVELQPRHDVVTGEVVPDADVLNADGDGAPAAAADSVPEAPAPAFATSATPDSSSPSVPTAPSVPAAPSVPGAPAAAPQPASTAPAASPAAPAAEEPGRKSRRKAAKAAKSGRAAKADPAASAMPAPPPGAAGGAAPGPAASAATPGEQARVSAPGHALQGDAIAALLAEADAAEMTMHRPAQPALSTETPGFAELLNQLGSGLQPPSAPAAPAPARAPQPAGAPAGTAPGAAAAGARTAAVSLLGPAEPAENVRRAEERSEAPAAPKRIPAPVPLRGTGDLVVLVGLGDDPLDTALDMSIAAGGADVRTAGELSAYGHLHLDGRQSATAARAHAVETEQTVIAAFGLGKGRHALARLQALAALSPDQVWVVVDAGRKNADTARWINLVRSRLEIDAMAVVGAAYTSSPETVEALNIPVGWIDGKPAGHPLPWAAADGSEG